MCSEKLRYHLLCPGCGSTYSDDGIRVDCDICSGEGRRAILEFLPDGTPSINKDTRGLMRYADFLPGCEGLLDFTNPVTTFQSRGFADKYGFKNLFLTVTGYLPQKNIYAPTCSFKELEAIAVLTRLLSYGVKKPLLLSSAGNTARAFAYYAAKLKYPVIAVVPANSRSFLWLPDQEDLFENAQRYFKAVFVEYPANYLNASRLAALIWERYKDALIVEGGYRNIGRTTGLGICALNFFETVGEMPSHYIQAVGSAGGVLAVLRSYGLLSKPDSRGIAYHLVQNAPYTVLTDAIENKSSFSLPEYFPFIDTVCSPMLTSADPAYDYPGGLRPAMDSGQRLYGYGVTNEEISRAKHEFWRLENIELLDPAAAAVAALAKNSDSGRISKNELIQLNITGCGESFQKTQSGYFYIPPTCSPVSQGYCYDSNKFSEWIDKEGDRLVYQWE